jgi:hypothetical protein
VVISKLDPSPTVLAIDASYVYYTVAPDAGSLLNVYQISKTTVGGTSGTLLDQGGSFVPYLGVIGTKLFSTVRGSYNICDFASNNPCSLGQMALPGTGDLIPFSSPSPQYFAQQDNPATGPVGARMSFAWYTTAGVLVKAASDVTYAFAATYDSFAAFADSVYWIRTLSGDSSSITDRTIYSANVSNPTPARLTGPGTADLGTIVDANAHSLLLVKNNGLYYIPLPGGTPTGAPSFLTALATAGTLKAATEDSNGSGMIYWFEQDGTLYQCPRATCSTDKKVLALGQSPLNLGIFPQPWQDSTALYWGNGSTLEIVRLAK